MSAIQLLEKIGASSELAKCNNNTADSIKNLVLEKIKNIPDSREKKWCVFFPAEDEPEKDNDDDQEEDETTITLN